MRLVLGDGELAPGAHPARRRPRRAQSLGRAGRIIYFTDLPLLGRARVVRRGSAAVGLRRQRHLGRRHEGEMKLLVTGGARVHRLQLHPPRPHEHPDDRVVNLDKLTYAGNPANLADVERRPALLVRARRHLRRQARARRWRAACDAVVNFAAETHVDRSILEPDEFLAHRRPGRVTLLEAVRELSIARFLHISTDEVYGSIDARRGSTREPRRCGRPIRTPPPRPAATSSPWRTGTRTGARRHHAVLQQLRPVPVPGEGHPAVRDQRARRPAAADLR